MIGPIFPFEMEHLWGYYQEMQPSKVSGGGYASSLMLQEIEAWIRIAGVELTAWEIGVLRRVDQIWHKVHDEAMRKRNRG